MIISTVNNFFLVMFFESDFRNVTSKISVQGRYPTMKNIYIGILKGKKNVW